MRHPYHADPEYYAQRAEGLLASARDGTPTALAAFADHGAPLTDHQEVLDEALAYAARR